MNVRDRSPLSRNNEPRMSSALPYVGAVSIKVAPPWTNRLSTSRSAWYSAPLDETWKLPEVPMPITGTISPLDGIGRFIIAGASAACAALRSPRSPPSKIDAARVEETLRNRRREVMRALLQIDRDPIVDA